MDNSFLCGIMIGLLFGIPAGAVGIMTVQRTLMYGVKSGLVTGLGSSVADCLYACVSAFGLTIVSDFLFQYQGVINIAGGSLILFLGLRLMTRQLKTVKQVSVPIGGVRLFVSSFAVGITNPAAILTFLFAFSWFGLSEQMGIFRGIQLVCGVFFGTYLWWGGLSVGVALLRKRMKINRVQNINRVFGILLIAFGLIIFAKTAMV